jgi:hypothetical protein
MASDRSCDIPPEQISPELALVDPDLAQRAREKLPDEWTRAVGEPAGGPATSTKGLAHTPPHRRPTAPRPRRRRPAILAVVVIAGAAAAIGATVTASPSRVWSWLSRDNPISASVASGTEHKAAQTRAKTTPRPAPAAGRPADEAPRTASTAGRRRGAPVRTAPPRQQARIFGWPRVAGTTFYLVRFYRGRDKIYQARLSKPRLRLPAHWTFRGRRYRLAPGRYRWYVRAVFGRGANAGRGKVIVRATLQIRKTAAD